MNSATTATQTETQRLVAQLSMFLPTPAAAALKSAIKMLERTDLDLEAFFTQLFTVAEAVIQRGLDSTTDGVERAIEALYDHGVMERIGHINPFLRDGAEIGIQLGVNTLKSLTPADVAKIIGLILVIWLAPNVLMLNAASFFELGTELATKLWNLP